MSVADEFAGAVTAHLQGLSPKIDASLARIASQHLGVRWLLFEYHSPHFGDKFAVYLHPMLPSGAIGEMQTLLDDGSVVVPASIYGDPRFEEAEPWDTASELLETWLFERWSLIAKKPPAFVGHHDSFFKTNLADGTRINSEEIAGRFGGP